MHLKRLDIQGFKTFATHTVLEFRPGITAIVGPNGSGKSNLNDAIRWVLGEQSYAALRCKRTEDLIFSGGGRRAPAGFAEVSLTIDNSDRLLPLPYGEVTITRRATRSGENEYLINRSRVRLRDLQEAVAPLGGSYTIINQGLVDAALTLRPEERRRLFEDAAEIGTFVARKAEAEQRLRETTTNVDRCADVLAELEPRLRSLKRQASLARAYRDLAAELHTLLVRHYTAAWHAAAQASREAEAIRQVRAAEVAARRSAQAAVTNELAGVREGLRALRERLGMLHNESSALHQQAETVQRDLAVGAERRAALARREEEAARSTHELALRRDELERERAAIASRLAAAGERFAAARSAAAEHDAARAAQDAERRAARQQLDAAQREELAATAALNELRRRSEQLAAERARLIEDQGGQAEALRQAGEALAAQHRALTAAEADSAAAMQARAEAARAEERARVELETVRADRARAEEALAAERRALADIEARFETLNRLQRSYAGTFAGVKAAMQWAETQGRSGFALVSSLIRTPQHLETAIEVALGSRLQNIVVERWEEAEDAIAALKQGGAGRATFLPLDTLRVTSDEGRSVNEPGAIGIAAALVEYDERYRDVAWYLLGRTLVVEDLPAARRVLRRLPGGWTIVTLSGEQVSSGGAVTGGSHVRESGALRRERELRELPEQIARRQRDVEARSRARTDLDGRLAAAERAERAAEAAHRRAAQEYDARRDAEARMRREVERAEAAVETRRRQLDQVTANLAALEEQARALEAEQQLLGQREQQARARLAGARALEQERAEAEERALARRTELHAAVAAAEGEMRAERALLQSHDQQIARLEEQRTAAARHTEELARERAALDDQLQSLEASHAALLAQIDELRTLIGPAEAEMAALEEMRASLEQREAALTAALLEGESAYGRAMVEAQRARDRLDTIWERAAADDIDVEALGGPPAAQHTEQEDPAAPPEPAAAAPQPESEEVLQAKIQNLKTKIQRLGAVNPLALEEYEETLERHTFMTAQLDDLRRAADSLHELITELDSAMHARFAATFQAIAEEFEKGFVRLFGGGEARLTLTQASGNGTANGSGDHYRSIDDLGIEITVRPPGKRQQNIALLSGGERALTAAALLFAILTVNPSPFCILDEVDAALDETNVGRFRAVLADMSHQTQFVLITHNRGTIEAADTIYGVTMGDDGASKVLSLRMEEVLEG